MGAGILIRYYCVADRRCVPCSTCNPLSHLLRGACGGCQGLGRQGGECGGIVRPQGAPQRHAAPQHQRTVHQAGAEEGANQQLVHQALHGCGRHSREGFHSLLPGRKGGMRAGECRQAWLRGLAPGKDSVRWEARTVRSLASSPHPNGSSTPLCYSVRSSKPYWPKALAPNSPTTPGQPPPNASPLLLRTHPGRWGARC